ncbi:MAG: mechanosensitive ion channel [Fimbriimonadaceae bacterium]|nr:mechanosensitive ion channel [Chitinophagales bacterium]
MLLQTTETITSPWQKFELWFNAFKMQLPNILLAIIFMVLIFILAGFVRRITTKIYKRKSDNNPAIATVMASFISVLFVIFGIFIALSILGLNHTVSSLFAGAGILGLILGLALQDTLSSAVAGIIMTTRKSYKVGDFVESNTFLGTIVEINLRNTTVRQTNGVDVKIPNKLVLANPLINYSLTKERRVDITVGVSYNTDPELVKSITTKAVTNVTFINAAKEIEVFFTEFGNNSMKVLVRFWIKKYKQTDHLQAQSEGIIAIKNAFKENGIEIPSPVYVVEMKKEHNNL